jgi:hypothetical protein
VEVRLCPLGSGLRKGGNKRNEEEEIEAEENRL